MHQITLHVTSLEFEIIKKQAARLYLGVAPEQIALYVRNSLVELLTEANLLTRDQLVEAITEETQSSASKSMTTVNPTDVAAAKARQEKREGEDFLLPQKERAGQETAAWKVLRYLITTALNTKVWNTFTSEDIAVNARLDRVDCNRALTALRTQFGGYIFVEGTIPGSTPKAADMNLYAFSASAKRWILNNQQMLREVGLFVPVEEAPTLNGVVLNGSPK
jgi:ribosomal protein L7/L12